MRILGIDPGSIKAGFAVLEFSEKKVIHIASGLISMDAKQPTETRLAELFQDLSAIIEKHKPSELAIENVFFAKNAQSALKLGQARGVILSLAGLNQMSVFEYSPRSVKSAICGSGKADKLQIEHMIRIFLKLPAAFEFQASDHSDALAICLAHGQTRASKDRRDYDRTAARQNSIQKPDTIHH